MSVEVADRRSRGIVGGVVGGAAEAAYRWVLDGRNRRWDRGEGVRRFDDARVVSVGNLSVGGSGKSPMVGWVVDRLVDHGERVMVVMRGYKGDEDGSDEELEHRARFDRFGERVVVRAGADRARLIEAGLASGGFDAVVLDDGFQHRRVARDVDIVLLDASRADWCGRCLPAGWLREPVESLRRADAVVLTRCDLADEIVIEEGAEIAREAMDVGGVVARARHAWSGFEVVGVDGTRREEVAWVRGMRVVVACGIGHPGAFVSQAERTGARVVEALVRPDHARWNLGHASALASLARSVDAQAVVTTRKDWVKLGSVWNAAGSGVPVGVVDVVIELFEGREPLASMLVR